MTNSVNERVREAIRRVRKHMPGYWQSTLESRLVNGTGSVTDCTKPDALEMRLVTASWEPYQHPAVMEGAEAFYTKDVTGYLGVVDVEDLPEDTTLSLEDPKKTGYVSGVVEGHPKPEVGYTVAILMVEDGMELCATVHPGAPVNPSRVPAEELAGKQVTVAEAKQLGLETVKVR